MTKFNPLEWANMGEAQGANPSNINNVENTSTQSETTSVGIGHTEGLHIADSLPDTTHEQIELVASMLVERGIDITCGYTNWLNLGFALADELGEGGRSIFHDLSRINVSQYNTEDCDQQYDKCLNSKGCGITIKTFFHMAQGAGIDVGEVARETNQKYEFATKMTEMTVATPYMQKSANLTDNNSQLVDNMIDNNDNYSNNLRNESCNIAGVAMSQLSQTPLEEDYSCENDDLSFPTFSDKIKSEDWPAIIETIRSASHNSAEEQDMMILGSLFTLSAVMPNYYGLYDDHKVYTTGYLVVIGPAASGKGDISFCRNLTDPIEDVIRKANLEEMENHKREMAAREAQDRKHRAETPAPTAPPYRSLYIPANSSTTSMCQALSDNHECGLIFETEGNTMAGTLKTEYGDYSDVLCKAFQHERIAYKRRKEDEHVQVNNPRLSIVMTMTSGQVSQLLPSYESGLGSRFAFYKVRHSLEWRDVFKQKEMTTEELFLSIGKQFVSTYRLLSMRTAHPIQFILTEAQQKKFNDFFRLLQIELYSQMGDDLVSVVRRFGLMTFRLAMILTLLRHAGENGTNSDAIRKEDNQTIICTDTDFSIAMTIVNTLVSHTIYVYGSLVPHTEGKDKLDATQALSGQTLKLYNMLTDVFTSADINVCAERISLNIRTAQRYIGSMRQKGLVDRIRQGVYVKTRKRSQASGDTTKG